jgi:uncharacterized small protein (DUF1192 family)
LPVAPNDLFGRPLTAAPSDLWRRDVAKALVGHFVSPDPLAAAQVHSLRRRVADLEGRVLLLEAELAAREAIAQQLDDDEVALV